MNNKAGTDRVVFTNSLKRGTFILIVSAYLLSGKKGIPCARLPANRVTCITDIRLLWHSRFWAVCSDSQPGMDKSMKLSTPSLLLTTTVTCPLRAGCLSTIHQPITMLLLLRKAGPKLYCTWLHHKVALVLSCEFCCSRPIRTTRRLLFTDEHGEYPCLSLTHTNSI